MPDTVGAAGARSRAARRGPWGAAAMFVDLAMCACFCAVVGHVGGLAGGRRRRAMQCFARGEAGQPPRLAACSVGRALRVMGRAWLHVPVASLCASGMAPTLGCRFGMPVFYWMRMSKVEV